MSSLFFCLGYLETQRTLVSLIVETLLNLAFSKHDSHLPSSPLVFVSCLWETYKLSWGELFHHSYVLQGEPYQFAFGDGTGRDISVLFH